MSIGDLSIGPFRGVLEFSFYAGARLVHVEAVVSTQEENRAYLYDAGLAGDPQSATTLSWIDAEGKAQETQAEADVQDRSIAVHHRTLVVQTPKGSIACFPPPHQYFFPRDRTDNQSTIWYGKNHRSLDDRFGFGIRQTERGGGAYVPWINAPPGSQQRLGVFYIVGSGDRQQILKETLRYTHNDRFEKLPGFRTLTSHFHMAIAMAALQEKERGTPRTIPDFVSMFKKMGVEMVHLAEFHGDGHPSDPGPVRLRELQGMFDECRRLSDEEILIIPGEEANVHLAAPAPGRDDGHWLYLFPKPLYWTMRRAQGQPFRDEDAERRTVYHVGNRADMLRLLEEEHGLAWTAHPRIKASSWTPDAYRNEDFYRSEHWLGAAWKAMPADNAHDRLGRRSLDLLDDMANWGGRKYVLGEVDVFKLDHTHELYGHMNVNYVRMDRLPHYDDGWKGVLDTLRAGRFFVTTGEVLIPEFSIDGRENGATIEKSAMTTHSLHARLSWTFPLRFAEVVSGDGKQVHRHRIELPETEAFGEKTLDLSLELPDARWARLEAWDVARNGAFTQPVWLAGKER